MIVDMQAVASIIAHPATIYSVVGVLVLWAACSAFFLWRGTSRLASALIKARKWIERANDPIAFASSYEVIAAELSGDPVLGPRWREYRDSLVLPREERRPVRATTRAAAWFDLGLLRARGIGIDARYHAALPNLLVGAGLLFTFLGLTAALGSAGGIVGDVDQAARNSALRALLDAASFKFITSLVGLFLSIAYALFRKQRLRVVERALDAFLLALEARVPLLTPATLQQEANDLLKRQSTQLETFSTDLAVNLGAAFDRAFDERLGEHIAPLTDAMRRLADGMGSHNEDAMQGMLDGFLKRLQGGAGDRMQEVAQSLGNLGSQFEGLQRSLGDGAARMAHAADAMADRMGQGAEAALARITDQISGLAESLRTIADQARSTGAEAGREMVLGVEVAARGFESTAARIASAFEGAATQTGGALERGAEEAVKRIAAATDGLADRIVALTSAADTVAIRLGELDRVTREAVMPLATTAADLREAGQAARAAMEPLSQAALSVGRALAQVADTAKHIESSQISAERLIESLNTAAQRFEGVDRELAKTLIELQTGLQGFTRHVGTFVNQTDQNLAKAATQLGNLVKGLQDTLDDFGPLASRRASGQDASVNSTQTRPTV
jgi:uncharacterized protein YoxC